MSCDAANFHFLWLRLIFVLSIYRNYLLLSTSFMSVFLLTATRPWCFTCAGLRLMFLPDWFFSSFVIVLIMQCTLVTFCSTNNWNDYCKCSSSVVVDFSKPLINIWIIWVLFSTRFTSVLLFLTNNSATVYMNSEPHSELNPLTRSRNIEFLCYLSTVCWNMHANVI